MGRLTFEEAEKHYKDIQRNHRRLSFVTSDGEIIQKNCSTVWNYLCYLEDLLYTHNMSLPYYPINLRDAKLLRKYNISGREPYSKMTKFLRDLRIIELVDSSYYVNPCNPSENECQAYRLNPDNYYHVYSKVRDHEEILYEGMFFVDYMSHYWGEEGNHSNVTQNPQDDILLFRYIEHSPEELYEWLTREQIYSPKETNAEEITQSDFYKNSPALFKKIEEIPADEMRELFIPAELSQGEISSLALFYKKKLLDIPAYKKALKEIEYISSGVPYEMRLHMDVKLKTHRNGTVSLKPSCRQWNPYCDVENRKLGRRDRIMVEDGFDLHFDIHSAIFSVTRYMNFGIFDIDWDLKRELIPDYDNHPESERGQIKKALSRLFFGNNISHSYYGLQQEYGNKLVIGYPLFTSL